MSQPCLTPRSLELSESDPEVERHAADCPRCHALLESYRSFLAAEAVPGARTQEAERDLDRLLRTRVLARRRRPPRRVLEPAAWLAAVAALLLFAWIPRMSTGPDESVPRGAHPERLQLLSPQSVDGGWLLRWDFVDEADHYELRLYSVDLSEVDRIGDLVETQFLLSEAGEDARLWRVYAYHQNELLAVSAVGTLSKPD